MRRWRCAWLPIVWTRSPPVNAPSRSKVDRFGHRHWGKFRARRGARGRATRGVREVGRAAAAGEARGYGKGCERSERRAAAAGEARGYGKGCERSERRAAAAGEASGYGCGGERERATLRVARPLATWQFELSGSAARRGLSGSGDASCPNARLMSWGRAGMVGRDEEL